MRCTTLSHEAMVSAYKSGGYTLKEIADHYGLHYSTVSRIVKRMRRVTK
ncbi:MAG: helix-turn-helix domain-containing protein [bacterium]|nr:helix-turn-helix domain-containing protein [bacterium]